MNLMFSNLCCNLINISFVFDLKQIVFLYKKECILMKHFISKEYLTIEEVQELLKMAKMFREDEYKLTKQIFVANLFFEPSTRTKTSFVVAERKLGLENLEFSTDTSSMKK